MASDLFDYRSPILKRHHISCEVKSAVVFPFRVTVEEVNWRNALLQFQSFQLDRNRAESHLSAAPRRKNFEAQIIIKTRTKTTHLMLQLAACGGVRDFRPLVAAAEGK